VSPGLRSTALPFAGDAAALLVRLPAGPGVGQILGPDERSLTIGAPANLRKWAASNLGAGPPPAKGKRPRTDLSPVATAVSYVETTSAFHQRLTYERLMARHVPLSARRDLKPPVFLHLDPEERFPRITFRRAEDGLSSAFGPFRDRRAAEKARAALHKLVPLRPCDYVFEPDPALPLGLSCLYAQVRSCAAPCLGRATEAAYRDLARRAADLLVRPARRDDEVAAILPPVVASAHGRGLVVAPGKAGFELYPVHAGSVLEGARAIVGPEGLEAAVGALRWDEPAFPGGDWPWLAAWLASPRGRGSFLALAPEASAAALVPGLRLRLGSAPA
jgi:hypothetical protein